MKEKTLLKIALICSLIGLFILFLYSENIEVSEKNIGKITLDDIDKYVKVKGIVEDIFENEKVAILKTIQPQSIEIILFKNENKSIGINVDDEIEVIGKVEEYEGKLEVIGHRVRVIG